MAKKLDKSYLTQLRESKKQIGPLIPIIVSSKTGIVVDGLHRIHVDGNWPKVKLPLGEKESLIARLALNAIRHPVEDIDFNILAAYLAHEGTPKSKIAKTIHELAGVSVSCISRHLSKSYKTRQKDEAYGPLEDAAKEQEAEKETTTTEPESEVEDVEAKAAEAASAYTHETAEAYTEEAPEPKPESLLTSSLDSELGTLMADLETISVALEPLHHITVEKLREAHVLANPAERKRIKTLAEGLRAASDKLRASFAKAKTV